MAKMNDIGFERFEEDFVADPNTMFVKNGVTYTEKDLKRTQRIATQQEPKPVKNWDLTLKQKAILQGKEPLTVEELKECQWDYVWVESGTTKGWAIVGALWVEMLVQDPEPLAFTFMPSNQTASCSFEYSAYGTNWLAYRSKPKEG